MQVRVSRKLFTKPSSGRIWLQNTPETPTLIRNKVFSPNLLHSLFKCNILNSRKHHILWVKKNNQYQQCKITFAQVTVFSMLLCIPACTFLCHVRGWCKRAFSPHHARHIGILITTPHETMTGSFEKLFSKSALNTWILFLISKSFIQSTFNKIPPPKHRSFFISQTLLNACRETTTCWLQISQGWINFQSVPATDCCRHFNCL